MIFISMVLLLLEGIVLHILFYRRMKRRVLEGHFEERGRGFWGKGKFINVVIILVVAYAPAVLAISRGILFLRRAEVITFDLSDIDAPTAVMRSIAMILLVLVMNVIFVLIGYKISRTIVGMYCYGRFGEREPAPVAEATAAASEDEKGKDNNRKSHG